MLPQRPVLPQPAVELGERLGTQPVDAALRVLLDIIRPSAGAARDRSARIGDSRGSPGSAPGGISAAAQARIASAVSRNPSANSCKLG